MRLGPLAQPFRDSRFNIRGADQEQRAAHEPRRERHRASTERGVWVEPGPSIARAEKPQFKRFGVAPKPIRDA
jgi:hypothetical protein